jgi:hypothetical protein
MPYCRRHELVVLKLINIKFNYKFIRLINVTEDCLFISKAYFNSKNVIRSTLLFQHVMFSFVGAFRNDVSRNTLGQRHFSFPGFLNRIYDRIHLNISMYKAMPGQCSQCFENFRGLLRKLKRATRHPRATSFTCVRYTIIVQATCS